VSVEWYSGRDAEGRIWLACPKGVDLRVEKMERDHCWEAVGSDFGISICKYGRADALDDAKAAAEAAVTKVLSGLDVSKGDR